MIHASIFNESFQSGLWHSNKLKVIGRPLDQFPLILIRGCFQRFLIGFSRLFADNSVGDNLSSLKWLFLIDLGKFQHMKESFLS